MMDFFRQAYMGFQVGVPASDPFNAFVMFRRGLGNNPLGAVADAYKSGGFLSAFGKAAELGRSSFSRGFGYLGNMFRGIPEGYGVIPNTLGAKAGYTAGAGLMLGAPIIAGAAAFSGLNNLRRGRYGRAAWQLALGAGLVGAMYASHMRFGAMPAPAPPHDYQI